MNFSFFIFLLFFSFPDSNIEEICYICRWIIQIAKPKTENMKKSLFCYVVVILLSSVLLSCSKDDDEQVITPTTNTEQGNNSSSKEESARYYVKYQVNFETYHMKVDCVIKFATEKGIQTITLNQNTRNPSWEGTYGPVDKHFAASLECSVPNYTYGYSIHAKINVCREKEPFVIKAENESSKKPLSLKYYIDF